MAISILPLTPKLPYYDFDVELDEVLFRLEFRFNGRDDAWYMKVSDLENRILRCGIKILDEWPLLRRWGTVEAPAGEIVAVNQGSTSGPPTLEELASDVLLHYLDAEELAGLV